MCFPLGFLEEDEMPDPVLSELMKSKTAKEFLGLINKETQPAIYYAVASIIDAAKDLGIEVENRSIVDIDREVRKQQGYIRDHLGEEDQGH